MAENNITLKNFKPTLKPPSDMGKKIDSQFKSKLNNVGVNINMIKESKSMINEKEESLKKKIFSLPKMETLVMTDEYLSNIFNKLKKDAQETYGYHWNETIMNIMFNEYVLNDTAYLEKYKNTKTYNKKRRGQEGVEELEKELQDKIDDKEDDGDKPEFDRTEKMADIETNKDNLDKFKQELDNEKMKHSGTEVAEQMKKALAEAEQVDELFGFGKPSVPMTTHKASKNDTYLVRNKDNTAVGVISPNKSQEENQAAANQFADTTQFTRMPWFMAKQKGVKGIPTEVQDATPGEFDALQQKYAGVPAMAETKNVDMTSGNGFELQYGTTTAAEAEKAAKVDSTYQNDVIYQNETTTSASSGAYVGPFPGKRKPVLDKPLWHGGTILKEGKEYLTNPQAFADYIKLDESLDKLESMINESVDEGSGISIKQHAQNILAQLDRMRTENPELNDLPEFGELIDIYTDRAKTGQVQGEPIQQTAVAPKGDTTHQWKTNEHHLHTTQDKIDFIKQHGGSTDGLDDAGIEQAYLAAEKKAGLSEDPSFKGAMAQDLKNTGRGVEDESTEELESKDGLFKGKWNTNEKAESKSQQRFMGMVHATQKGELDNPSPAVAKAAASMSDKDAKDFASTKHKGLPNHVKEVEATPAQGQGEDIYTKIGKLVYPDNDKQAPELTDIGRRFTTDFGNVFKGMSPEQIYKLLDQSAKAHNIGESMIDDQPDSMARTMDSPELNTSGTGGGAASASSAPVAENMFDDEDDVATAAQGDRQDPQAAADAAKFREFLQSKYGVDSVAELSPAQKRQIMKDLAVAKGDAPAPAAKPELDLKNFAATDAQKAAYKARDNKQLAFIAANNAAINNMADYVAMEKKYAAENGERMFHPMAILASIQALPAEEKGNFSNVEKVLTSRMKGGIEESKKTTTNKKMNEERQTPSQLNLQNIKKETAKLTQQDMAQADALKQAKVYPNPDEFYIEQDEDKIQKFKTGEDIEKEALKKMEEKQALQNAGNSTNNNGKELTKRNLSKEEMLRLAMNRGDGMHNIVYDNEPSEKFEKRLEKDMGEDQYKLRQEKMEYREDAPMYNKDTQPTEKGNEAEQDNKFKVGFNEAFTGKYCDDYGKFRLVEFMMNDVKEVAEVTDGYRVNLEGLGNKYTVKINENEVFHDVVNKFEFYLVEGKVVKVKIAEAKKEEATSLNESALTKMQHLMGYDSREFVNTKKSIKF